MARSVKEFRAIPTDAERRVVYVANCTTACRKAVRKEIDEDVFTHSRLLPPLPAAGAKSITRSKMQMTNIPLARVPSCSTAAIG